MIRIYHNPNCSKSRACVNEFDNIHQAYQIINFIENPLNQAEITEIIALLKIKPIELVRKNEQLWLDNFADKSLTDTELVKVLSQNPSLIERPIVINKDNAVIARPFEKIYEII